MPLEWQAIRLVQFLPQLLAYASFLIWLLRNHSPVERLGLARPLRSEGLRWGLRIGLALGAINVSIILLIVPWLGYDIQFLRETPHAQAPTWLMLPWLIMLIAVGVELNFRGFLLGRLLILAGSVPALPSSVAQALAIDLRLDGLDLCAPGELWLAAAAEPARPIGESTRIGLTKDAERVLRFYERGTPWVSGPRSLRG